MERPHIKDLRQSDIAKEQLIARGDRALHDFTVAQAKQKHIHLSRLHPAIVRALKTRAL